MVAPGFLARSPEEVGIDSDRLEELLARAGRDIEKGRLPGAQIAIARHGRIAAVRTFGRMTPAEDAPPATDETLYCIYSSTKGIFAVALWMLIENRALRLEERVADIVPEFGSNGKDTITVEQLVLHLGGFPYAPLGPPDWEDRDQRLSSFHRWRLNWEPGSRFEYHPTSAHWVIAEILERRSGMDFRRFVRERITQPLGLDELFIGLPPEQDHRVATVVQMTPPVEPPGGWRGVDPAALLVFNEPRNRRVGVPGGGGITGAAELALLYQPLIHGGEDVFGRRILRRETIEHCTRVLTGVQHVDPLMRIPVNRAVGLVVAGDDGRSYLRGFGRSVSPRAFGHGGAGGQIAWGDPTTGLSFGYVTNGFTDFLENGRRITALSTLACAALR